MIFIFLNNKKPEERLGVLDDGESIKNHKFFEGISWDDILEKKIVPPFIPSEEDIKNLNYFESVRKNKKWRF